MTSSFSPTWASDEPTPSGGGGIEDVSSAEYHVRTSNGWTLLDSALDATLDPNTYYVRRQGGYVPLDDVVEVGEAPSDNELYLRQNGAWVAVELATRQEVAEATSDKLMTASSSLGLLDRVGIEQDSQSGQYYADAGLLP